MLRLTRTGLGLLTRQYRSVLRKCWLINVGLWQTVGDAVSKAVSVPARLVASLFGGGSMTGEAFNVLDEILLNRLFERKLASLTAIGLGIAAATMPGEASAEVLTPTINDVRTDAITYLSGTHNQYSLVASSATEALSAGQVRVVINGNYYKFTPNESTSEMNTALAGLAAIGSKALTAGTSSNYVLYDGATYWTYDTSKLPTSVYSIAEGTSSDYSFKDGAGNYWKVTLNTNNMTSDSTKVTWQKVNSSGTNTVEVTYTNPNYGTQTEYYRYTLQGASNVRNTNLTDSVTGGAYVGQISSNSSEGGALTIKSGSTIETIVSDFIANQNMYTREFGAGSAGAIYNGGEIKNITGNFIANLVRKSYSGAAIHNNSAATIGTITGNFIGNVGDYTIYNGNNATIGAITGDFISNALAIYNSGSGSKIGAITGDFINNTKGGISNYGGGIDTITGYFTGNQEISIENRGSIGTITGNFTGNFNTSSSNTMGSAIRNSTSGGIINSITGDFTDNYIQKSNAAQGSAIYNEATINSITGNFTGNRAQSSSHDALGGAINNLGGNIGAITGNFTDNYVYSSASSSSRTASGGAIYLLGSHPSTITGNFTGNYAQSSSSSARGGAIYNSTSGTVIENSSFLDNYAVTLSTSSTAYAVGGAILTSNDLTLKATDGYQSVISGNYVEKAGVKTPEAIFVSGNNKTLTLETTTGGSFKIDDQINGKNNYEVEITGDGTGKAEINNVIKAQTSETDTTAGTVYVNLKPGGTLALGIDGDNHYTELAAANLQAYGGVLDLRDKEIGTASLKELTLANGNLLLAVDAGLRNSVVDAIVADTYGGTGGSNKIIISTIGLSSLTDSSATLTFNSGAYSQYGVDVSDSVKDTLKIYYDTVNYNSGTKTLTVSGKSAIGDLLGVWDNGNYIKTYSSLSPTTTSIGANLEYLDAALGKNGTYDFSAKSVADVLVDNYYTKGQVDSSLPKGTEIPDSGGLVSAGLVHQDGTETITGAKTFTSGVNILPGSSGNGLTLSNNNGGYYARLYTENGSAKFQISQIILNGSDSSVNAYKLKLTNSPTVQYITQYSSQISTGNTNYLATAGAVADYVTSTITNTISNYYTKTQINSGNSDGPSYIKVKPRTSGAVNAMAYGQGDIAIGDGAAAGASGGNYNYDVALGREAIASNSSSTALGYNTAASGYRSVALGAGSKATVSNVVSVGDSNSYLYRKIINVADGVDAHDAVTVGQIPNLVATPINTSLNEFDTKRLGEIPTGQHYINQDVPANGYHYEGDVDIVSYGKPLTLRINGDFDMGNDLDVETATEDQIKTKVAELVGSSWSTTAPGEYGTYSPYVEDILYEGESVKSWGQEFAYEWSSTNTTQVKEGLQGTPDPTTPNTYWSRTARDLSVAENLVNLDNAIGVWDADNRTISGHSYASNLVAYNASSPATTSVGANLVRLDTAILTVADNLANNYYRKYKPLSVFI